MVKSSSNLDVSVALVVVVVVCFSVDASVASSSGMMTHTEKTNK
jgi:hypothetical protein